MPADGVDQPARTQAGLRGGFFHSHRDLLWVLLAFLIARLLLSAAGALILSNSQPVTPPREVFSYQSVVAPPGSHLWDLFINAWYRWDAGWYLKIASLGYSASDGSVVFPPLYPLLIRLLTPLAGENALLAGLLVSSLACLAALVLFYALSRQELASQSLARRSIVYLLAFPTAYYLFAAYTESLFLALVLGAWLLARQGRWTWAGFSGGLACLTRLQGWWLVVPLLWLLIIQELGILPTRPMQELKEIISRLRIQPGRQQFLSLLRSGKWLPLLLPLAALLGYNAWLKMAGLGSITAAYALYWDSHLALPWNVLAHTVQQLFSGPMEANDWVNLLFFVYTLAMLVLILIRLPLSYSLYSWGMIALTFGRIYTYPLYAMPRYALVIFPSFWLLAGFSRRRWAGPIFLSVCLALQVFLLWLFLNWFWVA